MAPLAHFLTWRTYGTWLPGDERGWVDERRNGFGESAHSPDFRLEGAARGLMRDTPVALSESQRRVIAASILQTCNALGWALGASNVRTNHVHVVVGVDDRTPERILTAFKSYATRDLNRAGLLPESGRVWARGGSIRFLMDEAALDAAIDYVLYRQ